MSFSLQALLAAAIAAGLSTLTIPAGAYPLQTLENLHPAKPLTILPGKAASATGGAAPLFAGITVLNSTNLHFIGIHVTHTPTAASVSYDRIFYMAGCSDCSITGGAIAGGVAVNGVPITATELDASGNVLGLQVGVGIELLNCQRIVIEGVDVSVCAQGVALGSTDSISILNNHVHNVRTTPIHGGDCPNTTIKGNTLEICTPWNWGDGDHADFIHLWSDEKGLPGDPVPGVVIDGNLIYQGSGIAVLGINLEGKVKGFLDPVVSNNQVINGNAQAIRLDTILGGQVHGNTAVTADASDKVIPAIRTWTVQPNWVWSIVFAANLGALKTPLPISGPGTPVTPPKGVSGPALHA